MGFNSAFKGLNISYHKREPPFLQIAQIGFGATHPPSPFNGYRSFLGGKAAGVLTTYMYLSPRLRMNWAVLLTPPQHLHHVEGDFTLSLLSTSMMWKSIWFLLLKQAVLRATDECDRILPNGSVPLPSNMTHARHIPHFTVITSVIVRLLFIFATLFGQTYDPPATRVPSGYRWGFSLGVERPTHAANHTPPCRAEVNILAPEF